MTLARNDGPPAKWTPSFVAFCSGVTAEDVLVPGSRDWGATPQSRQEWTWVQTAQRLSWLYGDEEAARRLNQGAG